MTDIFSTPLLTARESARYLKMPESHSRTAGSLIDSDEPLVHAGHHPNAAGGLASRSSASSRPMSCGRCVSARLMPWPTSAVLRDSLRAEFDDPYRAG